MQHQNPQDSDKQKLFINVLPSECQAMVASFLTPPVSRSIGRCSFFASVTQRYTHQPIQTFLEHVVRGEQDKAEHMLAGDVELLLEEAIVTDFSGRQIQGTALMLALGAGDVSHPGVFPAQECMVEMLLKYLRQLPNRDQLINQQIQRQFPLGWEIKESERKEQDLIALNEVIHVFTKSNSPNEWNAAVQSFKKYLEPKMIITTGMHFNFNLILDAFQLYQSCYKRFGGYSGLRNKLWFSQIIGSIQFHLPASFSQALLTGIVQIVMDNRPSQRSLFLKCEPNYEYRSSPTSYYASNELGNQWAINLQGETISICTIMEDNCYFKS